ncbi:RPA-interacting protein B [Halyomorpha halys]|uniref:RPA-interacting protein B n=1 Tax=Halyomorpha halys TaxID=286706 RepID=UPI0034D1F5E4
MAGILVSPKLDDRIRKRSALYKKRGESPKFRDILRERCHARIRASRCALLDKFRNLDEIKSTLSGILKEEVESLTSSTFNNRLLDIPEEEPQPLDELEEDYWLIEEYDRILAEEEANFNSEWENQVICPICEKSVLVNGNNCISCIKCQSQFPPVDSLQTFKYSLDMALRTHNEGCPDSAQFALLKDKEVGLFLICESCMSFSQVL